MIEISTRSNRLRTDAEAIEATYRQILDLSPDPILVQVDDEIVFGNEAALTLLRANSLAQLSKHSFFDFLHPDSKVLIKASFNVVSLSRKTVAPIKHQIIALNGKMVEVETTADPMTWKGADAIQMRVRRTEIRRQFEIQLRESEAKFHQLADVMPQMVWRAKPDGKIDYRNRKFFEQTGISEDEANRDDFWRLVLHPDDAKIAEENWIHSVRTGEKFQMEYRYKDVASGSYRWHLGRALPIKDALRRVVRWFGTCTDIHDQKLVEIALEKTKEQLAESAGKLEKLVTERTIELEETVRSSEALNYSIAHDLRAPLRSMMGFSKALLEDYGPALDRTGKEYAERIAASAQRMDNLIGSLLSYGQLNYEELSFGFINTQLLLESLLRDLDPEIQESGARIKLNKPLPKVWANDAVLKRIFAELIENALKFHDPNQTPEIEIWAEEHETKTSFWIRDKGIGISPEHHERVFRVMECLHLADKYPGTGIGLAIVRRGVERLGGRLGLKSAPDQGSCFWIELPKALF